MSKIRLSLYSVLFLVPLCLLPFVTHRLIADGRDFGRETGQAYLRATAETWALRLARGEALPEGETGPAPAVLVALVDETGRRVGSGDRFPVDGRCFGEAPVMAGQDGRRVRATWPGAVGRGQFHRRRLNLQERAVAVFFVVWLVVGYVVLGRVLLRAQAAARRQVEYVADISHRLKTPLTSISLCAELARSGRLDAQRMEETKQTVVDEAAKLGVIVDEVLAHVKEMRRG